MVAGAEPLVHAQLGWRDGEGGVEAVEAVAAGAGPGSPRRDGGGQAGAAGRLSRWYQAVRTTTGRLAAPLSEADATVQSMPDASPAKWHLAHTTWFFEAMVLRPHRPGFRPHHPGYHRLFNSYYESLGERHPRPQRGLLTRLRTSVPRRRIQAWTLREGLLHRLLGRRALHVDTAAGVGQAGEQRGFRELAPIATPEGCDAIVREILGREGVNIRAISVADVLIQNGVQRERLYVAGNSARNPIGDNNTVEGTAKNRRVEILLIPLQQ